MKRAVPDSLNGLTGATMQTRHTLAALTYFTISTFGLAAIQAEAGVQGAATTKQSPNGITEYCVSLQPFPGGNYSVKDRERETKLCSLDLYSNEIAICPKTWSTSPGTMLYQIEDKSLSPRQYEATKCSGKGAHETLAKFKTTMNQPSTSGTFSNASLLYYHFSRYFDTTVSVPTTVYRTADKDQILERVARLAKGQSAMNRAAWDILLRVLPNPTAYRPTRELFTADLKQVYGILTKGGGTRYGTEINGIRSSWGDGQNHDFQATPAFLALRSESALNDAMSEGERVGRGNPKINSDLGAGSIHPWQMVYWMKELTEIALLDYIFSQQDRVGNIDYKWVWYWLENGKIEKEELDSSLARSKMRSIPVPPKAAAFSPVLVQRTVISDNDAGGRVEYTNFPKRTKMLEGIRHLSAATYRRLVGLDKDFQAQGALFAYVRDTFDLDERQLRQTIGNTHSAAEILKATCRTGRLRFDIDPAKFVKGTDTNEHLDCENP